MSTSRFFTIYDSRRLIRLVCITWFITKLICYKLWLADRLFPVIPIHDILLALPSWLHASLFIISLCIILLLVFFPGKKMATVLLLTEVLSCLLDQNRWQPWEYQFLFMTAGYVFVKEEKDTRLCWQLIIAGIYFFSGISKLNNAFLHDIWQGLLLRRWLGIKIIDTWLAYAGYILPMVELAAGICLLFIKTRKYAVWLLTIMHLIILLVLGPTGLNMNAVIWLWNILMPILLFSIFYRESFQLKMAFFRSIFSWVVLLCWWILPWFQLGGYWDRYLSAVLYGGGTAQLFICTDNPVAKKEMEGYLDNNFHVIPCSPVLSTYQWGMIEMNTAPYPEPRIYKKIIEAWGKRYPAYIGQDRFYIYKPGFNYVVKELLTAAD